MSGTQSERVFDLPVHRNSRWIFNCYVIEGAGEQSVVVDPGLPSTAQAAIDTLRRLGRSEGAVSSTSSHGHVDHVGGMPILRQVLKCKTFLPARCQAYLAGEAPRVLSRQAVMRVLPILDQQPFCLATAREALGLEVGFASKRAFSFPFVPDGFVGDASTLPGAPGWRVIETPGHTDDSISFYHADSETLISGDAVLTHEGRAWFNPERIDTAASVSTEERLRALPVRHLLPGHGLPISGDVWGRALSFRENARGPRLLARCARQLARWDRAAWSS